MQTSVDFLLTLSSLKGGKVLATLLENEEPARYHRRHLWMSQKGHTSALTSTGMSQTWLMGSVCLNGKSLSLSLKPVRWSNREHLKQEKSRPTQRDYTFRFIHSSCAIWTPKVWVTHWYLHVRKPLFKLLHFSYLSLSASNDSSLNVLITQKASVLNRGT